jgi:hypothetical protein
MFQLYKESGSKRVHIPSVRAGTKGGDGRRHRRQ